MRVLARVWWGLVCAVVVAPAVLVSFWMVAAVLALLPPPWNWLGATLAVVVVPVLAVGVGERLAGRVMCQAYPLSPGEVAALAPALTLLCAQGLGPPRFRLLVARRPAPATRRPGAAPFGRRTLVVDQTMVVAARSGAPPEQVAAVLAGAAGHLVAGHTRLDVARAVWTLPWQLLTASVKILALLMPWAVPLARLAWASRAVVGVIAIVQCTAAGRYWVAAAVGCLIVWTYAHPWARAQWSRHVVDVTDRFVADHGLGQALASYLRRGAPHAHARARADRLDPPSLPDHRTAGPHLALVRT